MVAQVTASGIEWSRPLFWDKITSILSTTNDVLIEGNLNVTGTIYGINVSGGGGNVTDTNCASTGSCTNLTYLDYNNDGLLNVSDFGSGDWLSTERDLSVGATGAVIQLGDNLLLSKSDDAGFGTLNEEDALVAKYMTGEAGEVVFLFVDSADVPFFGFSDAGSDDDTNYFKDSLVIGGDQSGINSATFDCSDQGYGKIDCDRESAADLGIADDLEVRGTTYLQDALVEGNINATFFVGSGALLKDVNVSDLWVNVTGDTMTGNLILQDSEIKVEIIQLGTNNMTKIDSDGLKITRSDTGGYMDAVVRSGTGSIDFGARNSLRYFVNNNMEFIIASTGPYVPDFENLGIGAPSSQPYPLDIDSSVDSGIRYKGHTTQDHPIFLYQSNALANITSIEGNGDIITIGNVNATQYFGDGSQLTNLPVVDVFVNESGDNMTGDLGMAENNVLIKGAGENQGFISVENGTHKAKLYEDGLFMSRQDNGAYNQYIKATGNNLAINARSAVNFFSNLGLVMGFSSSLIQMQKPVLITQDTLIASDLVVVGNLNVTSNQTGFNNTISGNTTFFEDVRIHGTLYGGSPVKIAEGIRIDQGLLINSTTIYNVDNSTNVTYNVINIVNNSNIQIPRKLNVDELEISTKGLVSKGKGKFKNDIEVNASNRGLILTDNNGSKWLFWIDDYGGTFTTKIASSPEISFEERVSLIENISGGPMFVRNGLNIDNGLNINSTTIYMNYESTNITNNFINVINNSVLEIPKKLAVQELEILTPGFTSKGRGKFAKDVEVNASNRGLILKSNAQAKWLVSVDDSGNLFTTQIAASPEISFEERVLKIQTKEAELDKMKSDYAKVSTIEQRLALLEKWVGIT